METIRLMRAGRRYLTALYIGKTGGLSVVISEIAIPTMIRREVCYGNAVHRGEMVLEPLLVSYLP